MELKKILILILIFCLALPSLVLAQYTPQYKPLIEKVATWGYGLIIILLVGGFLVVLGIVLRTFNMKWSRYLAQIGLLVVIIGVFLIELAYIIPMFGNPVVSYAVCEQAFRPITTPRANLPDPVADIVTGTACIFSGYVPSDWSGYGIATFFIFGIIAPFAMLVALFWEFTDFLYNDNVRRVIAFTAALMAFRFLLATLFIEILSYGFAGLGILLVDYLIFAIFFRFISKLWEAYTLVHDTMRVVWLEDVGQIEDRYRAVMGMLSRLPPGDRRRKEYEKIEEMLRKRLIELGKTPPV